jgi:hypothetical protein
MRTLGINKLGLGQGKGGGGSGPPPLDKGPFADAFEFWMWDQGVVSTDGGVSVDTWTGVNNNNVFAPSITDKMLIRDESNPAAGVPCLNLAGPVNAQQTCNGVLGNTLPSSTKSLYVLFRRSTAGDSFFEADSNAPWLYNNNGWQSRLGGIPFYDTNMTNIAEWRAIAMVREDGVNTRFYAIWQSDPVFRAYASSAAAPNYFINENNLTIGAGDARIQVSYIAYYRVVHSVAEIENKLNWLWGKTPY